MFRLETRRLCTNFGASWRRRDSSHFVAAHGDAQVLCGKLNAEEEEITGITMTNREPGLVSPIQLAGRDEVMS